MSNHARSRTLLLFTILLVAVAGVQPVQGQRGTQAHTRSSPADIRDVEHPSDDEAVDYQNYRVLRVKTEGQNTEVLQQLQEQPGVDFWTPPSRYLKTVDVMVSPQVEQLVTQRLRRANIPFEINIPDLKTAIAESNPIQSSNETALLTARVGHSMTFDAYHRYDVFTQYMDFVAQTSSDDMCATFSIGLSYEGRDLKGVKCGRGKREVWIDGGIHAREWVSPATVAYIINEFYENPGENMDILTNFTVYIIPITNPDGYEFSHTRNRLWRKTRSRKLIRPWCVGVDPNRNFDVKWMESGSSSSPCSEIFAGSRPFSESETAAIRDFILEHKDTMDMYLSFHSYSQMIFVPYAYSTERPSDYEELERVALLGAKAVKEAGGPMFEVGQASSLLYSASGGSDDWAKREAGIKYSFTFELRDNGQHGFVLPARYIERSGRETVAAVQVMIRAIMTS